MSQNEDFQGCLIPPREIITTRKLTSLQEVSLDASSLAGVASSLSAFCLRSRGVGVRFCEFSLCERTEIGTERKIGERGRGEETSLYSPLPLFRLFRSRPNFRTVKKRKTHNTHTEVTPANLEVSRLISCMLWATWLMSSLAFSYCKMEKPVELSFAFRKTMQ